jgi:hypothetical protein
MDFIVTQWKEYCISCSYRLFIQAQKESAFSAIETIEIEDLD